MRESKKLLSNVAIIRPILLMQLVFYHAFAPFSGAWKPIEGYPAIRTYWWLDKLSYAFMLETFVFVSGYVFGFQVRTKGANKLTAKNLMWGKFKRLMIPCVVFSFLYIFLFGDITQPFYKTIYSLFNGVGHMWFLPMLFWCFVGVWVIERLRLKAKWVILVLILLSICSFLPLPLQMGVAMYYMLFFYLGYILQKENISPDKFYTLKHCIILFIAFCVLFPTLTIIREKIGCLIGGGIITKAVLLSLSNVARIIYSSVGLAMIFCVVGTARKNSEYLPIWVIYVGNLCLGVYLFQQFILNAIYYHTSSPMTINPFVLPWVGFLVTLLASLILSWMFSKTRVGHFLIG